MKLFLGLYFIELYTLILYLHSLQHKDTTYFRICKILIKKFQKKRGISLGILLYKLFIWSFKDLLCYLCDATTHPHARYKSATT